MITIIAFYNQKHGSVSLVRLDVIFQRDEIWGEICVPSYSRDYPVV